MSGALTIDPLSPDRADDLVRLFQADSVCRGCWCQFWRMERKDFTAASQDDKRAAFLARIAQGARPPGLIASDADGPAAWVQITPREDLARFQRVPTARPAADTPAGTWALSCFFIRKDLRRHGLTSSLATAACTFATRHGATAVEAAARRPGGSMMWGAGFEGFVPALARAGFVEIEVRTPQRVLMRWMPT